MNKGTKVETKKKNIKNKGEKQIKSCKIKNKGKKL